MKWLSVLALATAVACSAEELPLELQMQEGVSFYQSFDNASNCLPERAAGFHKPHRCNGEAAFAPGVKGLALKSGDKACEAYFRCQDNLAFARPGSVSLWVMPVKWKRAADMQLLSNGQRKRLYQPFFLTDYQWRGYLGFERMTGYTTNDWDSLYFWILKMKGITGGAGCYINWQDGQWHNVVMTWDPLVIKIYVDGVERLKNVLQRRIVDGVDVTNSFGVCCPEQSMLDEFIIYERALTAAEVKRYYEHLKPAP